MDPPPPPDALRVREDARRGPFVEGLSQHAVTTYAELAALLRAGNERRRVAAHELNSHSSRSHAIFALEIARTALNDATEGREGGATDRRAKISLVDLAGSERQQKAGTTGERLREASAVNKSLTALGKVISVLAKAADLQAKHAMAASAAAGSRRSGRAPPPAPPAAHVPYRDSVLTWLLRESLGGNAHSVMLATVSPCAAHYHETASTLRYAEAAKKVATRPCVNEDPNQALIRQLREEVSRLRLLLHQLLVLSRFSTYSRPTP